MRRGVFVSFLLYTTLMTITSRADNGFISCYSIGNGVYGGDGATTCTQQAGCRLVRPQPAFEDWHFCVPDCHSLKEEAVCENYVGCKWVPGSMTDGLCQAVQDDPEQNHIYEYYRPQVNSIERGDCQNDNSGDFPFAPIGADSETFCYKKSAEDSDQRPRNSRP